MSAHGEAEEAGRRQAEAARSAKLDQASKVVIGTHQNTVDSFIDQIVARAEESVAQVAAADAAKRVAEESKRGGSEKNARAVAEELVFGFLIPEVERRRKKSEADVKEARFARAADDAAAEAVQKVQNRQRGPVSSTDKKNVHIRVCRFSSFISHYLSSQQYTYEEQASWEVGCGWRVRRISSARPAMYTTLSSASANGNLLRLSRNIDSTQHENL